MARYFSNLYYTKHERVPSLFYLFNYAAFECANIAAIVSVICIFIIFDFFLSTPRRYRNRRDEVGQHQSLNESDKQLVFGQFLVGPNGSPEFDKLLEVGEQLVRFGHGRIVPPRIHRGSRS